MLMMLAVLYVQCPPDFYTHIYMLYKFYIFVLLLLWWPQKELKHFLIKFCLVIVLMTKQKLLNPVIEWNLSLISLYVS